MTFGLFSNRGRPPWGRGLCREATRTALRSGLRGLEISGNLRNEMSLSSLGFFSRFFFVWLFPTMHSTCELLHADLLTFCSPKTASHLKWTGSTTVPWLRTSQMERKSWHEINGCVTRFGIQKLESLWSASSFLHHFSCLVTPQKRSPVSWVSINEVPALWTMHIDMP